MAHGVWTTSDFRAATNNLQLGDAFAEPMAIPRFWRPPAIQWCIRRRNGNYIPLIPLDELSFRVNFEGVPSQLNQEQRNRARCVEENVPYSSQLFRLAESRSIFGEPLIASAKAPKALINFEQFSDYRSESGPSTTTWPDSVKSTAAPSPRDEHAAAMASYAPAPPKTPTLETLSCIVCRGREPCLEDYGTDIVDKKWRLRLDIECRKVQCHSCELQMEQSTNKKAKVKGSRYMYAAEKTHCDYFWQHGTCKYTTRGCEFLHWVPASVKFQKEVLGMQNQPDVPPFIAKRRLEQQTIEKMLADVGMAELVTKLEDATPLREHEKFYLQRVAREAASSGMLSEHAAVQQVENRAVEMPPGGVGHPFADLTREEVKKRLVGMLEPSDIEMLIRMLQEKQTSPSHRLASTGNSPSASRTPDQMGEPLFRSRKNSYSAANHKADTTGRLASGRGFNMQTSHNPVYRPPESTTPTAQKRTWQGTAESRAYGRTGESWRWQGGHPV